MHEGHFENQLTRSRESSDRQNLRMRWPGLMAMLDNLPPTKRELDLISIGEIGPAQGWPYPKRDKNGRLPTIWNRNLSDVPKVRSNADGEDR